MELFRLIFVCSFVVGYARCYEFRLPNDTVPVSYALKIAPVFGSNTFTGSLNLSITIVNPTRQIVLHARNLTINNDNVQVASEDDLLPGVEDINSTEVDIANSLYIINTVNELSPQQPYVVTINYTGNIQEEMAGFSVASYNVNKTSRYIGVTHFEPTHARSVFPCYDEPRYRTNFTLEVVVPSTYGVISNVPVTNVTTLSNELQSFYFKGYRQMPTYLLAWVIYDVGTYSSITSTVSGVAINTWTRQGLHDQAAYANANSGTMLTTLWSYLNTPFGGTKIDQVTIPNFFIGAMENWGLITYAEESLLYKSGVTTTRDLQRIMLAVGHELSHQWFGDLVTIDSWSYPWLKEAFAQYFQYNITSTVNPSWQLADQIVVNLIQPALELDSTPQHALNNYSLSSEKQISLMFDDITYNKGAAMIRMLQSMFGEDAFKLALQIHFRYSRSGVTNPASLWSSMQVAAKNKKVNLADQNLDTIMAEWTDKPGHPVLSVIKTANGVYNITQERFLYSGAVESAWWIPLTFTTQTATEVTKLFLPPGSVLLANITANTSGWVLFNINQTGFYRVNYDNDNWQLLSKQLQSDLTRIPRINRAQLLDDLFNFARGGLVQYSDLFAFTAFLQKEVDYIPWVTAFRNFGYLLRRYHSQPAYNLLKEYILSLMTNVITDVGFQESASDGHLQKLKRALVLEQACSLEHSACVVNAAQMMKDWRNGVLSSSTDIQSALLCTAVRRGNSADWDFAFGQYLASTMPTQKTAILASLTCSQNATKLNAFLDSIITNNSVVSSKEFTAVLKALSSKPVGAVILLNYLLGRNYCVNKTLFVPSDYEEEVLVGVLSQIVPQLYSREDIMKLDAYTMNGTCLTNQSVHYIKDLMFEGYKAVKWQEDHNSAIYDWLFSQQQTPNTTTPPPATVVTTKPQMSGQSRLTVQFANVILCLIVSALFIRHYL